MMAEPTKSKTSAKAKSTAKAATADTGSASAQVTNFTKRIQALSDHLKLHKKDNSSRRGLLKLVGKRRRQLDYLKKKDFTKYQAVIKKLGLRR